VQAEEEVRNQLIPSARNRAEVPDRQAFRQAAGVHDLHPVIKDLHADLRAGDAVVAVHEGVHRGLAQNFDRDLVHVLPIDTQDFAADVHGRKENNIRNDGERRRHDTKDSCPRHRLRRGKGDRRRAIQRFYNRGFVAQELEASQVAK